VLRKSGAGKKMLLFGNKILGAERNSGLVTGKVLGARKKLFVLEKFWVM